MSKKSFLRVLSVLLVVSMLLTSAPVLGVAEIDLFGIKANAASLFSGSQVSAVKCNSGLVKADKQDYVNKMMYYYLTTNERVYRNLQDGSNVVFFFDGCSSNLDSGRQYSDFRTYHMTAYCAVVRLNSNKNPTIVYENNNTSTIPDNPRKASLNDGKDVPTVVDGIYNISITNHFTYAALHLDASKSGSALRCNYNKSYLDSSSGINIHKRSWYTPKNGVNSNSKSSTGCFNVGVCDPVAEYNDFIYKTTGKTNAASSKHSKTGKDVGIAIVDRYNFKAQLENIYGGDKSRSASDLVSIITKNSTQVFNEAQKNAGNIINKSNSKITAKDITIPYEIKLGSKFDSFSGTISSNNGLIAVGALITDERGKWIQYSLQLSASIGPGNAQPMYNFNWSNLSSTSFNNIDFSRLNPGKYRIKAVALCASGKFYLNPMNYFEDDNILVICDEVFTVKSTSRNIIKKATSNQSRNLLYDRNGNSYYKYNSNLNVENNNSQYNENSYYPKGNYTVTAKSGLNTRQEPSATSKRLGGLSYGKTVEVTSTNGNWGNTKYGWICLDYARYESSISTPVYNNVNYSTGNYVVNTAAGLNVRRNPGTSYARITALTNGTEFSVTSVDGSWGYSPDYNGWLCLNYARWVSDLVPKLPVPETPILTTTTSSEIGVGEIISLNWNAVDFTDSYTLSLIDQANSNVVETKSGITGTDASFVVPYAGTFDVSIVATNSQHTSRMAKVHGITAKAPSIVTFKDWNGNTLSTQQVAYGKDATLPQNPSRVGYTFTGWSGKYNTIREDSTVTAQYERNTYTVTFYDYDGVNVVATQRIKYEDAATAPSYSAPTGYSFVKWDKDFSCITEDTSVKAVIHWTSAYPLEISTSSSIYRNNTAYITTAIVNNSPHAVSNAKVIVALKTAQGKQLAEAVSSNLSLAAGEVKTITLTANYDGAATVGNIFVVKADNENIPLAKQLTVSVDQGTAWSSWSTSTPPADAIKTESRTEYRYRTKSFTTSSNSSLSGWTKYNTTSAYSDWSGWSAWQDSAISKTDLRDVREQTVANYNSPIYETRYSYKTVYHYYRYAKTENASSGSWAQSSSYPNYYPYSFDSPITETDLYNNHTRYHWWYSSSNWRGLYAADPYTTQEVASSWQEVVGYNNKTQYSYRTRSLNYTYYYYKWNDWSSWSTASQTANADKEVQTRTTYRYISNNPKNIEDTTGQNRTISGSVNNSYAGKQALIHIFTDNGTTQYLGQTTISANGSYSFSFKLKEEPTVSSGDYSVAMSIEGTTASFMLDPILAPVPEYTVTFKNYDGGIINSQTVRKGENAVVPSSPTRAGYEFLGWSGTGTNIQADTTITALYQIKELEVVFVDDLKGTREAVTYNYGDELTVPALTETEAYSVVGWDAVLNGISTVTENLVVTAKYQIKKFDVRFYDYEGNLVKEEKIAYGDGVDAAALENQSPYVFVAWDTVADFGYITENLDVYPVFEYEETVASPTANIDTGSYASEQTVTLTCETEGAKIYYTTDGSDPLEVAETSVKRAKSLSMPTVKGTLYTGPFTLDSSANLVFVAVKENMNDSWYDEETLAINTPTTVEKQHLVTIHDDLGEYVSSCLVPDDSILPIIGTDYSQSTGYTLVGVYRDEEMTMVWNPETDKITESMDLYLKWEKNIYTVNFLDKDGMLIDSQQVPYLESAVSPAVPEVEGFTFSGWDNSYSEICSDIDIKATYIDSTEITKISIDKNSVDLSVNETSKISATVVLGANSSNNHVIWQVEDGTIASVDDEGNVTAIDYGTTQVFTISEDSGDVAICEVNVVCQHNYESVTNNPTCTEDGETISTCSICGDTKTQSIASTGHLSGEWITDKDSTCTAEGTKHKECTVCHETLESGTIAKKAHTSVSMPGTPATCSNPGKTDGAKCSVCGTVITAQSVIPATGNHQDSNDDGKCDTCGEDLGTHNPSENCDHICHKGGFAGLIYKIIRIFWKLFRINKTCACGVDHY